MKKVYKVFVHFALLFVLSIPAFSQYSQKSIETFLMDDFDKQNQQEYVSGGVPISWEWGVTGSRYIAEGYPKYGYFKGMPNSLRQMVAKDADPLVFGVQTAFNRKGDNWIEVFPMQNGKTYEVPLNGIVSQFDFWVWGAGYRYYLEIIVRDVDGKVHVFPAGNTTGRGWRNAIVQIPSWVSQVSKLRSGPKNLSFVGFRVRSDAAEPVDDFTIYFDNIKYMANPLSYVYDGYDLREVDFSNSTSGSALDNPTKPAQEGGN